MNSKLDLFFVFIITVVVATIIGFRIVSVIDSKISSVTIEMPPVEAPKPNVTINIQKGEYGPYQLCMQQGAERCSLSVDGQTQSLKATRKPATSPKKSRPGRTTPSTGRPTPAAQTEAGTAASIEGFSSIGSTSIHSDPRLPSRPRVETVGSPTPQTTPIPTVSHSGSIRQPPPSLVEAQTLALPDPSTFYRQNADNWRRSLDSNPILGANHSTYVNVSQPQHTETRITNEKKKGYKPGDYGAPNLPIGHNYAFHDSAAFV